MKVNNRRLTVIWGKLITSNFFFLQKLQSSYNGYDSKKFIPMGRLSSSDHKILTKAYTKTSFYVGYFYAFSTNAPVLYLT